MPYALQHSICNQHNGASAKGKGTMHNGASAKDKGTMHNKGWQLSQPCRMRALIATTISCSRHVTLRACGEGMQPGHLVSGCRP